MRRHVRCGDHQVAGVDQCEQSVDIVEDVEPLDLPDRVAVPGGGKDITVFRPDTPVEWSF